ncbi:MAG: 2OG-Fe(II) oxygenase family protein [Kouleothrix sp.]
MQAGLQVHYEDTWIAAPPIPGTFVINIGEVLELASNGYLRANVHRVVTPPAGTDRLSVAFFFGARLDATVPLLALPAELFVGVRGPDSGSAQPAVPRGRQKPPQELLALASRCGAATSRRSARGGCCVARRDGL